MIGSAAHREDRGAAASPPARGRRCRRGELIPLQRSEHVSTYDEAIRTLRNSILLTDFDRRLRSLLMTSASPAEGKSTIAAHLAVAHAEQRHRTLLIDGDLRRPSVHKRFDAQLPLGLSNVLSRATAVARRAGAPDATRIWTSCPRARRRAAPPT